MFYLSFSYPPSGMTNQEFVNLKLNWMIENNKSELIESFLKQNKEFDGKSKAVQYLSRSKYFSGRYKGGM